MQHSLEVLNKTDEKFQELTSVQFGTDFIREIMDFGCMFKDCQFYADIHFNEFKMEIHVPVMDRKITLVTSDSSAFDPIDLTYNAPSEKFLENVYNYNAFVNALLDFANKVGISSVECCTNNEGQQMVLSSLGFMSTDSKSQGAKSHTRKTSTPMKTPEFYDLGLLRDSFSKYGLHLTKVFFQAIIDFYGIEENENRVGRLEYRYRLLDGKPVLSIFDAMDLIGITTATQAFKEYLEFSYGVTFKVVR